MTDKELLQQAAKAIGFGSPGTGQHCWTCSEYPRNSGKHGALWNYVGHMDTAELWNPLSSDGDAFRLMVQLNINVYSVNACAYASDIDSYHEKVVEHGDDKYVAYRRAILLCAASIGRQMEDNDG